MSQAPSWMANLVEAFLAEIAGEHDIEALAKRMGAAIAQPLED